MFIHLVDTASFVASRVSLNVRYSWPALNVLIPNSSNPETMFFKADIAFSSSISSSFKNASKVLFFKASYAFIIWPAVNVTSWSSDIISIAFFIWSEAFAYFLYTSIITSEVNHCPSVKDSANCCWVNFILLPSSDWYVSVPTFFTLPIATATSRVCFLNSAVSILAFCIDFQSSLRMYPAPSAWDNWYIAADAFWAFCPDLAAHNAIPCIAVTESSKPFPVAVNLAILSIMSVKL